MINKNWLMCIALVVLVAIVGIFIYTQSSKHDKSPKIVTQRELQNSNALSKAIHVKEPVARQIQTKIERVNTPTATFYVQGSNLATATKNTEQAIKNNSPSLPKVAVEKSDRTLVTQNDNLNKVDVYKINLNKAHQIKAGVTVMDNKAYPTVGYQAGRIEALAHFDGSSVKGGTVLYTVAKW